ncbi:hypothetical protein SD22575_0469 [Shigella dysenteriae 225-75]|nr:hypothetical protein SD22575_0469 [Shigella dysenteriae 225-75]
MPCFTAMRAEIALMSGSAFAVTHHAFSSGAGRTEPPRVSWRVFYL